MVRHLTLDIAAGMDEPACRIELELNAGRVYHAIARSAAAREAVIEHLVDTGVAAIVPADGGLMGNLKVWENLVLPAAYHGTPQYRELEERAARLFAESGVSGERFEHLCMMLPDRLSRFEQRLSAFVRAMLSEPRIMVYDSLFDGLSREETGKVLAFDRTFHAQFPLGTSLHLTADLPTLPDLGAHRTFQL
jgi:predicted ABC-type transport system involved in lysophospholipase L1 biosynthesis ATPase subunit